FILALGDSDRPIQRDRRQRHFRRRRFVGRDGRRGPCWDRRFRPWLVKDETLGPKVHVNTWGTGIFQLRREGHVGGIGLHKDPASVLGDSLQGAALQGQMADIQLGLRTKLARGTGERGLKLYTSM